MTDLEKCQKHWEEKSDKEKAEKERELRETWAAIRKQNERERRRP